MPHRITGLLVLVLAIAVVPACRQVLGLEEAKLEGAMGTGGGSPDKVESTPSYCEQQPVPACDTCLQKCGDTGFGKTCLEDSKCVLALDSYDYCLGSSCGKDAANQEECTFNLPPQQKDCARGCMDECAGTKLVSDCLLYCTCMADICTIELPADCMNKCKKDSSELTHCRRDHCTLAGDADVTAEEHTQHCGHAIGVNDHCPDADGVDQIDRGICLDGKENFWACNADTECCSEFCNNGSCDLP